MEEKRTLQPPEPTSENAPTTDLRFERWTGVAPPGKPWRLFLPHPWAYFSHLVA